jgi:dihydrolipoamide dehydrogenase
MKTAIIEKYDTLGGTCLNVGCIPSKALLDSTEHVHKAKEEFAEHGINVGDVNVDFKQMIKRKGAVVKQTVDGVNFLMKKNKIDVYHGMGSFKDKNTIVVEGKEKQELKTDKVIIATGSKPASLPFIEIDKKRVITSTEALELDKIPKSMVLIGGGIIGVEMGSVFARLGTKVTIVEYMDRLVPSMDKDLSKEMKKSLSKIGIDIKLSHKVKEVKATARQVTVKADDKKGEEQTFKGEYCLVAVGRKPYTEGLGLDKAGLKTNDKGQIPVNDQLQTEVDNIYAIGDVVRGAMLAHKAEEEGIMVAEHLAGQKPHINYKLIPSVAYTWPEAAGVGYTEEELKVQGRELKIGKFPFKASGRARASMDTDGLIKVIADKNTDEILGMHMIGPRIADLIMEGVVAMEYRASAEDVAMMSHPHPTYSEAVKEACLAATENRALHI